MTLLETARFNAAANRAKRALEDAMDVCSAEIERINAARAARGVAPLAGRGSYVAAAGPR